MQKNDEKEERGEREILPPVQVRMVQSIAGLADPEYDLPEFAFQPGQIVELHPGLAQRWIAGGIAESLEPELETASLEPGEKAVRGPGRPRKIG